MVTGQSTRVVQKSGHLGAEILGIDLKSQITDATVSEIRNALLKHRVVFLRNQHLNPEQQAEFAKTLGSPYVAPHNEIDKDAIDGDFEAARKHARFGATDIMTSPTKDGGKGDRLTMIASENIRADTWHVDYSVNAETPDFAVRAGIVFPPYGGDTLFASLAAAYKTLAEPTRRYIASLRAVHTQAQSSRTLGYGGKGYTAATVPPNHWHRAEHPLVRVHPETKEEVLWISPAVMDHVVGLSKCESDHLLAMLFQHATQPELCYRHHWEEGDIVIWDQRATLHKSINDYGDVPRTLRAIDVGVDVTVGPDGQPSRAAKLK